MKVKTDAGTWEPVPPLKVGGCDALVMNLGDMAHRWSNEARRALIISLTLAVDLIGGNWWKALRATPHRVINRSGRDRYSIAFFWDGQLDMKIDPRDLSERWCLDEECAKYVPICYGDYLRGLLNKNYDKNYDKKGTKGGSKATTNQCNAIEELKKASQALASLAPPQEP